MNPRAAMHRSTKYIIIIVTLYNAINIGKTHVSWLCGLRLGICIEVKENDNNWNTY